MQSTILVTGGAGFIGANFVLDWIDQQKTPVVNVDKLTYAGNLSNLAALANDRRHRFVQADINNHALMAQLLERHQPCAVVHFAAESHVDRSIHAPGAFLETNVQGTFHLLESVRAYWQGLPMPERQRFRFLHVSTDEVYGSLGPTDTPFAEDARYAPNSPYAASKAASDHLVRAWQRTYGLPAIITNCSNNYGPYQFPEKLIPLVILNALAGQPLPVYGDGRNIRDWLYVGDHCAAIRCVLAGGQPGETYNIGGSCEVANIEVVQAICGILDEMQPLPGHQAHAALIRFIDDRPGHDRRYAIDQRKLMRQLGWRPRMGFMEGLRKTVGWYLEHLEWVRQVQSGAYRDWLATHYVGSVAL